MKLNRTLDVLHAIDNFNETATCQFLVLTYIVLIVTSCTLTKQKCIFHKRLIKRFTTELTNCVWQCLRLCYDQEQFELTSNSGKLIWIHYAIAFFILCFGYLCNLMSTDLVASINLPLIDSIDDLETDCFRHVKPTMFRNQHLHPYIESQPSSSIYGRIFKRINASGGLIDATGADHSKSSEVFNLLVEVTEAKRALLVTLFLRDLGILPFLCRLKLRMPKLRSDRLYTARQIFGSGTMNALSRIDLDYRLRAYMEYTERTELECGWFEIALRRLTMAITKQFSTDENDFFYMKCVQGIEVEPNRTFPFVSLSAFSGVLLRVLYGLVFSAIFVIVEVCHFRLMKFYKS